MRAFFTSVAGLIGVIILVLALVLFISWQRVPDIIANHLSKKLKVFVEIGSVSLGWSEMGIHNIHIGNPPNTVQTQALKCEEINIKAPLTAFFKNQVIIDEIDVKNVFLDLEFDSATGTKGNWSRIMGNLQESSAPAREKSPSKQIAQNSRSVYIKKLVLSNIDVDVLYIKEGGKLIHLPRIERIELQDISSEGGLPMDQVMNSILGQMLKSVFQKQNLKNMLQNLIENPPGAIQKYLNPFKGLFQSLPEEKNLELSRYT